MKNYMRMASMIPVLDDKSANTLKGLTWTIRLSGAVSFRIYADTTKMWSENLYDRVKIRAETFSWEKYLSKCNRTKYDQNQAIVHPKITTKA